MTQTTQDRDRGLGPGFSVVLLAMVLIGGCGTKEAFLLDSDIPIPNDSSGRATSGIERADGILTGVDTVFATNIADPGGRIDALAARFKVSGWEIESRGGTYSTATVVFAKTNRRCRVRIVRNELDPDMSRIAYNVWTVAGDAESRKVDG